MGVHRKEVKTWKSCSGTFVSFWGAVMGLHCCLQAFSNCGVQVSPFSDFSC